MEYGLIGEKLSHSFSPCIHSLLGEYAYELIPLKPGEVESFVRGHSYRGLNVTIPYKKTVVSMCDRLSPEAEETGSVNTLAFDSGGRLIGHNTDIAGFIWMADRKGVSMSGRKVVILGSGGTSHTAAAAAKRMGAREIAVISRSGPDNYGNLEKHADAEVLVNTTPVGMYPDNGKAILDLRLFPKLLGVLDVIYNPLRTKLIIQAEELGIACSSGLPMLVGQAAGSFGIWSGDSVPPARVEEILKKLKKSLTNLVLVGMPGSGKTTIASSAAKKLGREAIDIDELVVKTAGKSIPEIFQAGGEEVFRDLESNAIKQVGKKNGCVISCGGGAVIREENYAPLRQNSVIIYVERDLSLLPRQGRPLSQDADLAKMLEERLPRYLRFADARVSNNGSVSVAVKKVLEVFDEISGD
ncbi:MAG: shikimate kinase [Oscillospiraceae bacterium]|jgi:shikimate dehydrogenase